MTVWDTGTYRLHKWNEGKEVIVTLFGHPDGGLGGVRKFAIIHTGTGDSQPEKNWLMHLMETDPEDQDVQRSRSKGARSQSTYILTQSTCALTQSTCTPSQSTGALPQRRSTSPST